MPDFSERYGYKTSKILQVESIDDALKNRIWSYIYEYSEFEHGQNHIIYKYIWVNFFKLCIDEIPVCRNGEVYLIEFLKIAKYIYFNELKWHEIFDFIEFMQRIYSSEDKSKAKSFSEAINGILEEEKSGYRMIGNLITPITDETETKEIEDVFSHDIKQISEHVKTSMNRLSDRENPDYRNSIKEAISAVEAAVKFISNNEKASLKDGLRIIEKNHNLHKAFIDALIKLYGYTSDEGGIRHCLTSDSEEVGFAEAKFMLVACVSFCNYLLTKKAELDL